MGSFKDRRQAGRQLAEKLGRYKDQSPVVLALPRGGVPVALPIAQKLEAPLDLFLVRKLGAPFNPELAIGAVTESGDPWINNVLLRHLGLTEEEAFKIADEERTELARRSAVFASSRSHIPIEGRTIILVDDGLATGATCEAAVQALRKKGAGKIVVAVPAAATSAAEMVGQEADDVITIINTENFMAVGQWYDHFDQLTDEQVKNYLEEARKISTQQLSIEITEGDVTLPGELTLPPNAKGLIIFAHGSGSSYKSPRNQYVAEVLNHSGLATLLFDLLTPQEATARGNVFDIALLTQRLCRATQWARQHTAIQDMPIAYFGASTGAAAALCAAKEKPVFAVVSRGGRPDLANDSLSDVRAPVLLIVGENDTPVIELNQTVQKQLTHSELAIVPGATHLFEEPGALKHVAVLATDWLEQHLPLPEKWKGSYGIYPF